MRLHPLRRSLRHVARLAVACLAVASCSGGQPLVPRSLVTPPLVLAPATATGVTDERGRFREILCAVTEDGGRLLPDHRPCAAALLRLAGEPPPTGRPVDLGAPDSGYRVVLVPGMGAACFTEFVRTYSDALEHLERLGYPTATIPVGGRTSSAHNARQIRDFIKEMAGGTPAAKDLILIGHSKGAVDILEAVIRFPELRSRVAAVVSVAGPIGGSPLADNPPPIARHIPEYSPFSQCEPGDRGALESVARSARLRWLAEHELPEDIAYFSLPAIASPASVSLALRPFYDRLSEVDPRNDGMVIFYDAIIPGSVLLGYARADHWAVAVPVARTHPLIGATALNRNAFPREALLEAVVRHVEERLEARDGAEDEGGAEGSRSSDGPPAATATGDGAS